MEEFELRKELLLGEDSTRQFKREPVRDDKMAGEMVAFANSEGGRFFIGVDKDGTIRGLTGAQAEETGGNLAKLAWDSVRPPFSILTEAVPTSDGIVLVVTVPDGTSKPYCDKDGVYWVKNGPDKRRIRSPEELARLFQLGEKLYAENQPVAASTLEDFDRERFARFYERKYDDPMPDPVSETSRFLQILENLCLISKDRVTVAGLLLFGKRQDVLLPEMKIDAIWFKGADRSSSEWWDQRSITGTLDQQYESAMGFFARWSSRVQNESTFNSQGREELPWVVLEELLTNALVHRDYFIKDSIKLFIFDDRIEIRSPGKLPNNLSVEQIMRGVRRSRNVVINSFAPDLLNYRGVGSGILRALRAWHDIEWHNDIADEELSVTIRVPVNSVGKGYDKV